MGKLYKVDNITERTTITRAGKVEKSYRVEATTASGSSFTEDIPADQFNKEKVGEILTARAALIEDIRKL